MGQAIREHKYSERDFRTFADRLQEETELLSRWFRERRFLDDCPRAGFELEVWLVDPDMRPAAINAEFLASLQNPHMVPELAKFNVELNSIPRPLRGPALALMHAELDRALAECRPVAQKLDAELLFIGILPTVTEQELSMDNMTNRERYRALNEQVLRMRSGRPLLLNIRGRREHLKASHNDVMPEAAATSLQIHLQVRQDQAVRYYNAALILAGPMTAVCANAPYLYGRDLWDDTRIPLFEQAVDVGESAKRVTFGAGYLHESLFKAFRENQESYGALLPTLFDTPVEALSHLRLHNGTIWRWNRPHVDFNDLEPHLRIEHRVASAGPSTADTVANMAFFYGLLQTLATQKDAPESLLAFKQARWNFYAGARWGLAAPLIWLNGNKIRVRDLVLDQLLPQAREGLAAFELDRGDIEQYLGIIEERMRSRQNGAAWQRAYVNRHGSDMKRLTRAYAERQRGGTPVHEWEI